MGVMAWKFHHRMHGVYKIHAYGLLLCMYDNQGINHYMGYPHYCRYGGPLSSVSNARPGGKNTSFLIVLRAVVPLLRFAR